MPEKYTRIGTLGENLYTENTPLILEKTALTVNNENGAVFAQVKMKNIGDNVIKAVKVVVSSKDDFGKVLPDTEFTYLDLHLTRDATAGEKTPIFLADNSARSASVRLDTVAFEDGSILSVPKDAPICVIPEQETVAQHFSDVSLCKQYGIKYGIYRRYYNFPMHFHDLWFCSCGTCNRSVEETCYHCGKKIADFDSLDEEELKRERDARLEEERRIAEEKRKKEEERRIAAEAAAKKRKKAFAIGTSIVAACIAFLIVLTTVIIPKQKLNKAMGLLDSGDYDSAYALFEELGNSDAIASSKYDRAIALIDSGDYDSAYALLEEIGNSDAIASSKYDRAIKFIDSGDYEPAYMLLNGLSYKDSEDKLNSIMPQYKQILFSKATVGDTITFGAYEQDNNTSNGKEDIEWKVLAKEDNKILVISKYALDCQPYNTSYTDVTWENCTLRKWLNDSFLNTAFDSKYQELIPSVSVSADKNPECSTNPGNATTDKVFLLSITEVEKYFSSDSARKCKPTKYAVAHGANVDSDNGNCRWWLRSPGARQFFAALVFDNGPVFWIGDRVDSAHVDGEINCVRPAMWINLE